MISTQNKKNIWYFGLEPVKARYTEQLSKHWIPSAFDRYNDQVNFVSIDGEYDRSEQINVGVVLDACGRGMYAMSQCSKFLSYLSCGQVKQGDVMYFQDFWHPGIESIFYALDLYGIKVEIYSMLHAQSVDEYDFTYQMRDWMRPMELGIDRKMTGIFVGSTIHKDQLKAAGFQSKIHVVSLPFGKQHTLDMVPVLPEKKNQVIFASRLDKEKNPYFLLEVIKQFLDIHENWEWVITTSGDSFRSNLPGVVQMFEDYMKTQPRLKLLSNLTKPEYYHAIAESKIMFNSSLQDYVSWTSIEAHTFNTMFICPDFRSFKDFCRPGSNGVYDPFNVDDAMASLVCLAYDDDMECSAIVRNLSDISDTGRQLEAHIMVNGIGHEINIWHEYEYCKSLIN